MCKRQISNSSNDTAAEHELVRRASLEHGAAAAAVASNWADGGAGATDLADALIKTLDEKPNAADDFKLLYDLDTTIESKIETIAREMYGAGGVELGPKARAAARLYTQQVSSGGGFLFRTVISYMT